MQKLVTIADDLPDDLRLLALSVLTGEQVVVNPMIDCWLENAQNKQRITANYVLNLEDELRQVKSMFRSVYANADMVMDGGILIYKSWVDAFNRNYFKLEQQCAALGRTGAL